MAIRRCARNVALFCGLAMNLVFERLARFVDRMALHASGIGVRFVQSRFSMPRRIPIIRVIIPHVLHSADFRKDRAEHPIICVANVAALIAEIGIFAMH